MAKWVVLLAVAFLASGPLAQDTPAALAKGGEPDSEASREEKIDARIARIENEYGVRVHWRYNENFLPGPWRKQSKGTQIKLDEAERLLGQIENFTRVVPSEVTRNHLKNIYMLHNLVVMGHTVCMAHGQDLFMSGNMGAYLIWPRLFHEFSHVLHQRVRLNGDLWRSQMPEGARYVGEQALGGNPFSTNENYYTQGFLMQYSRCSLEEEFAILSDFLFTKQKEFKALMQKYPAVKNRARLTIAYYKALSKDYDFSFYADVLREAEAPLTRP